MNPTKTRVWLYVARGMSVSFALAALVAFVVLEHRRLNPAAESGSPATADDDSTIGLPLEVPALDGEDATGETAIDGRIHVGVRPALDSFQIEVPRVEATLEPMALPDLASTIPVLPLPPPKDDDLLVYTPDTEIYMMSSKSAVPMPEPKKRRQPATKP